MVTKFSLIKTDIVDLPVFHQNTGTDLIYIPCRMFGETGFQPLLLRNTQVSLALAVIFQAEKRQPRPGKGKPPLRQNRRPDIQNPANRSGVFFCIQQQKRTGTLPHECVHFTATTNRFGRRAVLACEAECLVLFGHAGRMHVPIQNDMRRIDSPTKILRSIQAEEYISVYVLVNVGFSFVVFLAASELALKR